MLNDAQKTSNPDAIKKRKTEQKVKEKNDLLAIEYVMSNPLGRRFVWRILEQCKVFESIWSESNRLHYNSGKQDIGHWLMTELTNDGFLNMIKESKEQKYD